MNLQFKYNFNRLGMVMTSTLFNYVLKLLWIIPSYIFCILFVNILFLDNIKSYTININLYIGYQRIYCVLVILVYLCSSQRNFVSIYTYRKLFIINKIKRLKWVSNVLFYFSYNDVYGSFPFHRFPVFRHKNGF